MATYLILKSDFVRGVLDWDSELCMSRVSRERKVQVPESFERFCCAKICRDQSLKQEPVRELEMSL